MVRKVVSLILAAFMLCGIFAGCNAVGEIAGNVADAAMKELENQVKATLEKNKVNVVELKTAIGKLNDDGSEMQFFCAALVKSDTDTVVNGAAEAMGAVFEKSGVLVQTGSKVESEYLVHKDITYFLLMVQYMVPGAVLAWSYDRSGSLWTPIGLHAAVNALATWAMWA